MKISIIKSQLANADSAMRQLIALNPLCTKPLLTAWEYFSRVKGFTFKHLSDFMTLPFGFNDGRIVIRKSTDATKRLVVRGLLIYK